MLTTMRCVVAVLLQARYVWNCAVRDVFHNLLLSFPSSCLQLPRHLSIESNELNELSDRQNVAPMLPRALQQRSYGARRRSRRECIAVMFDVQYEDHRHVDEPLACELLGEDLNGEPYKMVRIQALTSRWARKNNVTSGVTTIFVPSGADIDDRTSELVIPTGSTIKVSCLIYCSTIKHNHSEMTSRSFLTLQLGRRNRTVKQSTQTSAMDPMDEYWSRNLAAVVVRTVVVIRIKALNAETTLTESDLANKIFGLGDDKINLSSRFRDCSDGQMLMQPVTSNSLIGTDGVYTVLLPTFNASGVEPAAVVTAALNKAQTELGTHPKNIANHVIFCTPPGTNNTGWIAYASINYWQSVYNDLWCQ